MIQAPLPYYGSGAYFTFSVVWDIIFPSDLRRFLNPMLCDLHVHSHYSDGTCSPAELISLAQAQHLGAIALCDHNTIAGLPDFLAAAEGSTVRGIPGIEFSTDYQGTELHILGLFIQPRHYDRINELLAFYQQKKEESNLALAKALRQAGYDVDYEAVKAETSGIPNRAHFSAVLIEKGYFVNRKECFQSVLSPKNGLYTPPPRPDAFEIVSFIKDIGAVAILAHPFLSLSEEALREFLEKAVPLGLDGMETLYSTYDAAQTQLAQSIAAKFHIKESGGSDFHGSNKPDISIGLGHGNLAVPIALLHSLESAI